MDLCKLSSDWLPIKTIKLEQSEKMLLLQIIIEVAVIDLFH